MCNAHRRPCGKCSISWHYKYKKTEQVRVVWKSCKKKAFSLYKEQIRRILLWFLCPVYHWDVWPYCTVPNETQHITALTTCQAWRWTEMIWLLFCSYRNCVAGKSLWTLYWSIWKSNVRPSLQQLKLVHIFLSYSRITIPNTAVNLQQNGCKR